MAPRRMPLDRKAALAGRPLRLPAVRTEERDNGGLLVTIAIRQKAWRRLLGFPQSVERSFGLDTCGRQVYESCDGRATVKQIVRQFSRQNGLNEAEAELAVTTFLKMLMSKGLVAMEVEKKAIGRT